MALATNSVLEADLLNRLTSNDFSRLNDEELVQLQNIVQKLLATPQERKLSVAVDDEGADHHRLPRCVEMLTILSRYEASLIAGRSRAINLLYALKAARAAAKDHSRSAWASPANGRLPKPQ